MEIKDLYTIQVPDNLLDKVNEFRLIDDVKIFGD